MTVKLSGSLPGGDRSGLDQLQGELVRNPQELHVVVAIVDCAQTTVKHGNEGDTYTPQARLVYIEPVQDQLDAEVVQEILGRNRAQRVGNGTLSFELGLGDVREGKSETKEHHA